MAIYLITGLAAGVLSGLFGIGGGVVIVAVLVSILKLPMQTATGTSLAALLLPVGALGVWEYWKSGHVEFRGAGLIALGLLLGAWVGAKWAQQLHAVTLQRAFAVFLVAIAARMWIKAGG
jgi:uncharacterized protein